MAAAIMMLRIFCVLALSYSFAAAIPSASAQYFQDGPLSTCPGYAPYHAGVSELAWSANCFLHALLRGDKALIAALAKGTRCRKPVECDGPLDKDSARFAFGEGEPWDNAGEGTKSLRALIKDAEHVIMRVSRPTDTGHYDTATVAFIPRPGPASSTVGHGWMRNLFICDFAFDEDLNVWVIAPGFCLNETDAISGSEEAYKTKIDLNARDADFPILIWRPKMSK